MRNVWPTRKLADISDLKDSLHQTPSYSQDGYPMIRVTDIKRGFLDLSEAKRVDFETYEKFVKNYKPHIGDIIFSRVGSYGNSCYINSNDEFCIGQNTVCISPRHPIVEPFFLYSYLTSPQAKEQIDSFVGGASQPTISLKSISGLLVPYPPLPTQRKIAAILSAYDDLIENNLRRIKILEEMAQNLYAEWFVRFRFPGHEKVKMVDSPLGRIPDAWHVGKLNDVLITIESGSRPKGGINAFEREIPSIGAENILGLGEYAYLKEKFVSKDFFNRMTRGHIKHRDVLLYKDGAQIGRKAMFGNGFPHSVCCINEHVFILRVNNQISQSYLYFWLDQSEMTQNIKNLNANSAQPGINQVGVKSLPILIPTKEVIVKFDELCEPLLSELFLFAKENNILRKTRNLLLPKLISGELDISDLDIKTGDDE